MNTPTEPQAPILICAWCPDTPKNLKVSHGICIPCAAKMLIQIDALASTYPRPLGAVPLKESK